jgi:hypothetical protein
VIPQAVIPDRRASQRFIAVIPDRPRERRDPESSLTCRTVRKMDPGIRQDDGCQAITTLFA